MVYESDFYTSRRPYSRPSVPITSYSVTHTKLTPGVGKAHTYHPSIPFIAHKRMNNVTTPVPHNSVRRTVIDNTLDRIYHKPRAHPSYDPMEDFLNERSVTSFEDVSRSIRANTAALLKKVHTPIPRAIRPLSISNQYDYIETPISDRISSDEYIWHLLRPLPGRQSNGIEIGYYPETSVRVPIGKTHLACLSYAGNHPISKRRQLIAGAGDDYRNVRNDVELLSYYNRMRAAASHPHENGDVNSGTSNASASFKSYTAPTAQHTTEKVLYNGSTEIADSSDDKENVASPRKKSLKKKPSFKSASRDHEDEDAWRNSLQAEEDAKHSAAEQAAEEELALRLEADRLAEEERLLAAEEARCQAEAARQLAKKEREEEERRRAVEEERQQEAVRLAEEERRAEEARLLAEEERKAEEAAWLAEETRLAHEQLEAEETARRLVEEEQLKAEEERLTAEAQMAEEEPVAEDKEVEDEDQLAEEERQRLLEEQLVEEYHREQLRQAEYERQYAEELQRKTQEKLMEEQKILHEKLLEVQQQQEREEAGEVDEDAEEDEEELEDEELVKKSGNRSLEASDEEPAIAENLNQEVTEIQEVRYTKRMTVSSSVTNHHDDVSEDDEKSGCTDANSEISEVEDKFDSDEPNKELEITAEPKVESPEESEEESE